MKIKISTLQKIVKEQLSDQINAMKETLQTPGTHDDVLAQLHTLMKNPVLVKNAAAMRAAEEMAAALEKQQMPSGSDPGLADVAPDPELASLASKPRRSQFEEDAAMMESLKNTIKKIVAEQFAKKFVQAKSK
jgi:acyl carrier protein